MPLSLVVATADADIPLSDIISGIMEEKETTRAQFEKDED